MSRLQSLREEGVQAGRGALLACLLIANLQTNSGRVTCSDGRPGSGRQLPTLLLQRPRRPHVALQLGDAFGELGVGRLWQLGVEALAEAPPAALLVFTLTGQNTEKPLAHPHARRGKGLLGNIYLFFCLFI